MTIPVSEQFLSFQGEGPHAGQRAIFLRTHACNLLCGGGKYKAGSTWTCDTIPVFTKIQKRVTPEELLSEWQKIGWVDELASGTHLVITGGEPLMFERQEDLIPFLKLLCHPERSEGSQDSSPMAQNDILVEVETNGTIAPTSDFDHHITHYNCSPKLSTSGMPREMRLVRSVIEWHRDSPKSIFKFVVSTPNDIDEILADFVRPFNIPTHKVWLMPAASSRAELMEHSPMVAAAAHHHGWNFSTRLHILLYDQTTGV